MRALVLLSAVALGVTACGDTGPGLAVDRFGKPYPAECRRDLTADASLTKRTKIVHQTLGGSVRSFVVSVPDQFGRTTLVLDNQPAPERSVYGWSLTAEQVYADNLQRGLCKVLTGPKAEE